MPRFTVESLKKLWYKYSRVYRFKNDLGLPVIRLPKGTYLFRAVPATIHDSNNGTSPTSRVSWCGSFTTAANYAFTDSFDNMLGETGKVICLRLKRDVNLLNLKRCDDARTIRKFLKKALDEKMKKKLSQNKSLSTSEIKKRIRKTLRAFDYAFYCKTKIYERGATRRVLKRKSDFEKDALLAKSLCKLGLQGWANYNIRKFHEEICVCDPAETIERTGYEVRKVCGYKYLVLTKSGRVIDDKILPGRDAKIASDEFDYDCDTKETRYNISAEKQSDAFLRTKKWQQIRASNREYDDF